MVRKNSHLFEPQDRHVANRGRAPSLRSRVINLTEQIVTEEAEALLAGCNDPVYRQLFAIHAERQRLIRYAMNRVGNVFVVESSPAMMAQHRMRMAEQRPDIQKALYEGMQLLAEVYGEGVLR